MTSIIESNLEYQYIQLGVDIKKKYKDILKDHLVERLKSKFDYLNNREMEDTQVAKDVMKQYSSSSFMKICHYNKKTFGLNDEIEIYVDIKDIPKMQVKVFEINTDNYFRKNMSAFTSDINLDGLIAKYETEYIYTDKPSNL